MASADSSEVQKYAYPALEGQGGDSPPGHVSPGSHFTSESVEAEAGLSISAVTSRPNRKRHELHMLK